MKSSTERGCAHDDRRCGLCADRDRNRAEVDLVVDEPDGLTLLEAGSSMTASSSLFDGVGRVRRRFAGSPSPCDVAVAYGGDRFQQIHTASSE